MPAPPPNTHNRTHPRPPALQVFVGDFFKWQHESVPSWDVGYDYTFMCALHPTMRPDWAAAWARYLAQPGSQLVCLAFPLNSDSETGPPWAVTVQQYKDLLRPHGERACLCLLLVWA